MIVVEEKLNYVAYADGHTMPTFCERLTCELNNRAPQYLSNCEEKIKAEGAEAIIHKNKQDDVFLVEGIDNLYYVSGNQVRYLSREIMFEHAVRQTLVENMKRAGRNNGYDTSNQVCDERMINATTVILKHLTKTAFERNCINPERIVIVPYLWGIDFSRSRYWSEIRKSYELSLDDCNRLMVSLSDVIKEEFDLKQVALEIPVYSYNWFVSNFNLQ